MEMEDLLESKKKFKITITFGIILIGVTVILGNFVFKVFASYKEVNQEKKFSSEEINEIQVNMTREHISLIQEDTDGELRFRLHGKSKQDIKLTSELNNKVVVIRADCEDNPMPRNLDPTPEDLYLDIYIPEKYEKSISISVTSGTFEAKKLNAKDININTSSGNIGIEKLNAEKLKITGKSSAIKMNECIADEASAETSSGNIDLKKSKGNLNLKSSSGNIHVSCKEFGNQDITIVTSSGAIALQLPGSAEFMLEASSSTGKLKSDFTVNTIENKKMAGQIGTKNNKVLLRSSSGSVSLLSSN